MLRPTVGSGLVISWAGMRGIVSLAAALALPAGVSVPRPDRADRVRVVLGTLVIQGLTLKPLLRALDLHDDDPVGQERRAARDRALKAGLASLADDHLTGRRRRPAGVHRASRPPTAGRRRLRRRGPHAEHSGCTATRSQAARQAVFAMRASDEIGDDAFHEVEEELDWLEMADGKTE